MSTVYELMILVTTLMLITIFFGIWRIKFFKRQNVTMGVKPIPFMGHFLQIFLNKEHFVETLQRIYKASVGQRYTGFFAFTNPIVVVRDLDLIKQIGIKDFDHFVDHKVFMDEEAEPLFGSNLFFLKGQKWRDMRATLSPAYTGSKMKGMFPLVIECAEQFKDFLLKDLSDMKDGEIKHVEIKETMTRYTNDVIASTAFGYKINSFEDRTNKFFVMGKKATNFSGWQFMKFQAYAVLPTLMKKIKLSLFPQDVVKFFRNLVQDTMKSREKNGIIRYDMIHLLMLAKKGCLQYDVDTANADDSRFSSVQGNSVAKQGNPKREWSDDDLTAQAIAFIVAGFGTPSSLLCFISYEIARHPHVQRKLHMEIDEWMKKTGGKPTYADLQNMKYTDMVISETLRLWPPDGFLERVCVKPYTLPPQNEFSKTEYKVNDQDEFLIPIFCIQRDPEYFPNPEEFDPERFSDENKGFIKPFSYIPFGVGPRLCIGARFALMEAKSVLFHIFSKFEFSVTSKTTIPFVLAKDTFNMHPADGLWLGVKKREIFY